MPEKPDSADPALPTDYPQLVHIPIPGSKRLPRDHDTRFPLRLLGRWRNPVGSTPGVGRKAHFASPGACLFTPVFFSAKKLTLAFSRISGAQRMVLTPQGGTTLLFGIPIGRWTRRELIDSVCAAAARQEPLRITYLNAHNVNVMYRDASYRAVLAAMDAVYADGMSIVWVSRRLCDSPLPERVNAGDFFVDLCEECARRGLSLYLLGSEPGVAKRCAERLTARITGLRIFGASDGFWARGGEFGSEEKALEAIRAARPDILLVGLGVPRQELWVARHADTLVVPVLWCVGALFEYFGGRRARAPVWMRRLGLEWLFRLAQEPRRLAKRYLWGNLEFTGRVWREIRARKRARRRIP